jgi:hypothetical protein
MAFFLLNFEFLFLRHINFFHCSLQVKVKPISSPEGSRRFRLLRVNRKMKVVILSALGTDRFYLQKIFLVFMSVGAWFEPRLMYGRKDYVNGKFKWHNRGSSLKPPGSWRSASTNCVTTCTPVAPYTRTQVFRFCISYSNLRLAINFSP